jgi:hypothetical protein
MNEERKGHWIRTYSGGRYWPSDPRPQDVKIEDIAHHLSLICRYNGAVPWFYSVAEHSYHVSFMVPRQHQMYGLLHDAHEAYIGDVTRPFKKEIGEPYKHFDRINWAAVALRFGLDPTPPTEVKEADAQILHHELAAMEMEPTVHADGLPVIVDLDVEIHNWEPETAEWMFLQRYRDLQFQEQLGGT